MKHYCKAYPLSDLRKFSRWAGEARPAEAEMADDAIVYLTDEFTVLVSPMGEPELLLAEVTPEWRDFCVSALGFKIPEDLAYAYADSE